MPGMVCAVHLPLHDRSVGHGVGGVISVVFGRWFLVARVMFHTAVILKLLFQSPKPLHPNAQLGNKSLPEFQLF